ncbi:MAG: sodium:solute symporter family protein [Gemmatimonadota bacterium]|nr:MAG: sodium:solute symporter family protein [Gemmatimonadota bacterium]
MAVARVRFRTADCSGSIAVAREFVKPLGILLQTTGMAGGTVIDAIVVVGYLCTMLLVGWRSRGQSAESYWVADRQNGTRRITVSLVATVFGASSTFGIIGLGYARGMTAAWWALIGAIALALFGLALAPRVRELGVYTLPDILKRAYGNMVAVPAAIMIVVAWCGIVAAQMTAGARVLSGVLAVEYTAALSVAAAVFILYTFWGGQLSVLKTDSWQLVLFGVGLVACVVVVAIAAQDSPGSLIETTSRDHLRFPISGEFGWYDLFVFYPLIIGLPYLVGPDIYSRVLCAKDNSVARRSALIGGLAIVPISFMLAVLGILLRELYPDVAQEAALPTALRDLVPVGLTGLIAAGFLAAIMSSADTTLVSAATILSLNVIGSRTEAPRAPQLRSTRVAVLGLGLVAWLIAGLQEGIIPSLLLAYTIFVGGVVFPTLGSFYRDRLGITARGAMWAVIVGGVVAVVGEIHDGILVNTALGTRGLALAQQVLGPQYLSLLPILLSLTVMMTVSWTNRRARW